MGFAPPTNFGPIELMSVNDYIDEDQLKNCVEKFDVQLHLNGTPLLDQLSSVERSIEATLCAKACLPRHFRLFRKLETLVYDPRAQTVYLLVKFATPRVGCSKRIFTVFAERKLVPTNAPGKTSIRTVGPGSAMEASISADGLAAIDLLRVLPRLARFHRK